MEAYAIDPNALSPTGCPYTQNHQALWVAAIREYWKDVCLYDRNGKSPDKGEAYADLLTGCELLDNLCQPLGLDVEIVSEIILSAV